MSLQLAESFTNGPSSNQTKAGGGNSLILRPKCLSALFFCAALASTPAWCQYAPGGAAPAAGTTQSSEPSAPAASSPPTQGGNFSGSVPSQPIPGVLSLSLQDAIDRGLKQNLGLLLSSADIDTARGQRYQQL